MTALYGHVLFLTADNVTGKVPALPQVEPVCAQILTLGILVKINIVQAIMVKLNVMDVVHAMK